MATTFNKKFPMCCQLNKRDLPNVLPVDALSKQLRRKNEPVIESGSPSRVPESSKL